MTMLSKGSTTKTNHDTYAQRRLLEHLIAETSKVLDPLISAGSSVVLLDYPNNPNVGDSLIWLGEMAYLRSRGVKIDYVCDVNNYSKSMLKEALGGDSTILLQGGGNFGTLWPEVQQFRLQVLRDFPGATVIQFPQSIHFDDALAIEETAQEIRSHGNYTLLVRDCPSFDFALKHFQCKVILCPDMAFSIGSIKASPQSKFDRFILSRTDHEKSTDWLKDFNGIRQCLTVEVKDWLQASWPERVVWRIERHTKRLRNFVDPHNKGLLVLWNFQAMLRLNRGKLLLERGRVVISDRLHVHILSILMNKPHVLLDNVSRKVSSLHEAWTRPYQGVIFVQNPNEALSAADELDSRVGRPVREASNP